MTDATQALRRKITAKGAKRHKLRADLQAVTEELYELIREGHAAGITEVELADLAQVDRARTVRGALGK